MDAQLPTDAETLAGGTAPPYGSGYPARRMKGTPLTCVAACTAAVALAGCGSSDSGSGGSANPSDKQAVTLECLAEKGFAARSVGATIEIDGPEGPRVEFNVSGGESETRAFKGEAQGAEQIGSTLLFVGAADDRELDAIEECVIG